MLFLSVSRLPVQIYYIFVRAVQLPSFLIRSEYREEKKKIKIKRSESDLVVIVQKSMANVWEESGVCNVFYIEIRACVCVCVAGQNGEIL